jgi:hypothetical protein
MAIGEKASAGSSDMLSQLTDIQVKRLSQVSGVRKEKLKGLSIAEISDKFKFELDYTQLFHRQVCGQVVKTDPDTGVQYPVPFATVHVEDTDCNLLTYAPDDYPYIWYFPFFCHREVIATTVTDACGRFCVNIPRWDIDSILKWRKERICFPDIFIKPSIKDFLDDILQREPDIFPPRPEPDPVPWILNVEDPLVQRAVDVLGRPVVEKIAQVSESAAFGKPASDLQQMLSSPAFKKSLPPPLPENIKSGIQLKGRFKEYARLEKDMLHEITTDVRVTARSMEMLKNVRMDQYIGPFRRCFDIYIPQWSLIFDVPDITFRVTQDVDGDGDEETIYSENLFDVRWDSGDIPDVTLEASQIAVSSDVCDSPGDLPCEEPAIVMAGLMPLHNPPADPVPYHDQDTGYAKRPNRPHPTGGFTIPTLPSPPPESLLATAPFTGSIQLYGCNEHAGAMYYRLRYTYNGSAPQTFTGHSWKVFRWVGTGGSAHMEYMVITPDANGWYEILPSADGWLPSQLLLSWPTKGYQNGLYDVHMELGNSSKSVIHTTPEIGIRVDNTWGGNNTAGSVGYFTVLRWRHAGEPWQSLLVSCPVIRRDAGKDVEIEVGIEVAAPHLRSIILWGSGCGGGHPELVSSLPAQWESHLGSRGMRHWHTSAFDNSYSNTLNPLLYRIPASADSGVYGFHLRAHSRAFNPAGGDGGYDADWHYSPVDNWIHPNIQIAVVDN